MLGDDALDVLRDLKKWIRFYDEKMNRMDVARCIADSNVVDEDMLHILAMWTENEPDSKFKARLALACLEVMVPLTWPFDKDPERLTMNIHRNMPVLELAQVRYKRAIINYDAARILHTAVRLALPSMAMPIGDRSPRDQGIIKLVLYFLRNTAMIVPPPGVKSDGDPSQISRSALVDAFSYQDIFLFILTIASNMGDDFRTEDVVVMEILFHLLKRVNADRLFMSERQQGRAKADELVAMMKKEEAMHRSYNKHAPTRHNRFGTTIWVKRDDGKMSTLSSQGALMDAAARRRKLDESKSFKPPKYRRKNEVDNSDLGPAPKLNSRAREQLRSFVEEFLDSGFNPLFQHIRKTLDRDAQHALHYHPRQFFYLVAWFLRAERARQKAGSKEGENKAENDENASPFNLVAGVLNQEMFITLQRSMRSALDNKSWGDLIAVMRCFTQILLTVQEMTASGNETDEEIAENILGRLFYEDTVHDLVTGVIRNYNHQGFEFLDAATELTHHFVRILEAYSKKNVDMQVRSRRRARKKKRDAAKNGDMDGDDADELGGSEEDEQQAQKTVSERKFDFESFAQRFVPQGVVDTFVEFLKHYKELDDDQLKRAHRYFYRLAFKQNKAVMLFRVDIIHLLYNMIKGPAPLDKASSLYKDWEELVKQILKKCIRKIQERPTLVVEMLFSKNNEIAHYIETGTEREQKTARARAAAELEFRHTEDLSKQIGIVVGTLLDRNEIDHITWVKRVLRGAEDERREWARAETVINSVESAAPAAEGESGEGNAAQEPKEPLPYSKWPPSCSQSPNDTNYISAVRADNEARRMAMLKNPYLRLLMTTVGIRRLSPTLEETLESIWMIPPEITVDQLKEFTDLINAAEFNPPLFEDGSAEDQVRRKTKRTRRTFASSDEEEDLDNVFPAGGPTNRRAVDGEKKEKKTKRRRKKRSQSPDDAELDERARRRREKEREKRAKVKSQMYVYDSDLDSEADREFFAREEELRQSMQKVAEEAGQSIPGIVPAGTKRKTGDTGNDIRRDLMSDGENSSAEESGLEGSVSGSAGSRKRLRVSSSESESESESVAGDNDELVWPGDAAKTGEDKVDADGDIGMKDAEPGSADEDDEPVAARPRPRVRGGFVIDSSDEE